MFTHKRQMGEENRYEYIKRYEGKEKKKLESKQDEETNRWKRRGSKIYTVY